MTTETMNTYGYAVPNRPKFPTKQSLRLDPEAWSRFGMGALSMDTNRTELIEALMDWYMGVSDAELPTRPSAEQVERINAMSLEEITEILRRPRRRSEDTE